MSSEAAEAKAPDKRASIQTPVSKPTVISTQKGDDPIPMTREQRLAAALDDMIDIKELGDPHVYLYQGRCKKCGWHTHQMEAEHARQLCRVHVQAHWKDAAMIAQQ